MKLGKMVFVLVLFITFSVSFSGSVDAAVDFNITVLNSQNNKPVIGARVTVTVGEHPCAEEVGYTDSRGMVTLKIDGQCNYFYKVSVEAGGFSYQPAREWNDPNEHWNPKGALYQTIYVSPR